MSDPVDELMGIIELSSQIDQPQLTRFIDIELTNGREPPKSVNFFSEDAVFDYMPEWLGEAYASYTGAATLAKIVAAVNDRALNKLVFEAAAEYQLTVEKILTALDEHQSSTDHKKFVPALLKDVKRNTDGEIEWGESDIELLDVVAGEAGEAEIACYKMLLNRALYDLEKAITHAFSVWKSKKEAVNDGRRLEDDSWLNVLDERLEWMVRIPKGEGMGWKVTAATIEKVLALKYPHVQVPSKGTIDHQRRLRLKKQQ